MAETVHKVVYRIPSDEAAADLKKIGAAYKQVAADAKEGFSEATQAQDEAARQQKAIAKQREQAERQAAQEIKRALLEAARAAREAAKEQAAAARAAMEAARRQEEAAREAELALQRVAQANALVMRESRRRTAELQADLAVERQGEQASRARAQAKEIEARIVAASIDPESRLAAALRTELQEQARLRVEIEKTTQEREQAARAASGVATDRAEVVAQERIVAARRQGAAALRAEEIAQQAATRAQQLGISIDSRQGRELLELAKRRRDAADATRAFEAESAKAHATGDRFNASLKNWIMGFASVAAGIAAGRAAIRGIADASREFGAIEEDLTGVAKTTNMTEAAVEALYRDVLSLSTASDRLPIATHELLEIAEAAGQLGVSGRENLLAYIDTLGKLSRTSDVVGKEGAEQLAVLMNLQGELPASAGRVGAALTALGNDASAGEKQILAMAKELSAATTEFKLGSPAVLGLATALAELGREPEAASTAFATLLRAIQKAVVEGGSALSTFADAAGVSASDFSAAWGRGPMEAIELLLKGVSRFGDQSSLAFDKLGLSSDRLDKTLPTLAANYELLSRRLRQSSEEAEKGTALNIEAAKAFDTQNSRAQALQNTIDALQRSFGEGLAPALSDTVSSLSDVSKQQDAIDFFRDLGTVVGEVLTQLERVSGWFVSNAAQGIRQIRVYGGTGSASDIERELADQQKRLDEAQRNLAAIQERAQSENRGIAVAAAGLVAQREREVTKELGVQAALRAMLAGTRAKEGAAAATVAASDTDAATAAQEAAKAAEAKARAAAESERRKASELQSVKESEKAQRRLQSALEQLAAIEIKVRDTEAETLALRREAAGFKLPLDEQIELNRQLEIERRIREESKALRAILADPRAPGEARDEAAKRLREIEAATRGLVLAEEGLASSGTVKALERREEVARRMGAAYLAGEDAIRRATLATEREDEATQTAIDTGNDAAALAQLRATQEAEADARGKDRIGTLERQVTVEKASVAALLQGRDAAAAAAREEEIRQSVMEQMIGLEDKWRATIEKNVRALKDYEDAMRLLGAASDLRGDADFAVQLTGIDESSARLRELEEQYLGFLRSVGNGSVAEGERLVAQTQDMLTRMGFGFVNVADMIRDSLEKIDLAARADRQRGAGDTGVDVLRETLAAERETAQMRIDAHEDAVRVTADLTARERAIRLDYWNKVLADSQAVLGQLANVFGGFFSYLQQAAGVAQQATSAYSSASGLATQLGGSAALSGYAGAFAAYLVVVAAAVDAFEAHRDSRRARQYDYAAGLAYGENGSGFELSSNTDLQSRRLAQQIEATAEAFADAIGGSIVTFEELEITVRQDGEYFAARVGELVIGHFRSMDEAVSAGLAQAFADPETTFRGVSDLVRQGMTELFGSADFSAGVIGAEEAQRYLVGLREIAEINWSDAARGLSEQIRHWDDLADTLGRMNSLTPAVQAGLDGLVAAQDNAWQSWQDSITGRERTAAEQLEMKKQEAELFNAQRLLRIAELQMRKLELQAQAALLEAEGEIRYGNLRLQRDNLDSARAVGQAEATLREQELAAEIGYLKARAAITTATSDLTSQAIAVINAQLAAIDQILANLDALGPIDVGSINIPSAGGGGRRQEREALEDRLREIILGGLSDTEGELARRQQQIEELVAEIGRLGPNAALAAEALGLLRQQLGEEIRQEVADALNGPASRTGLTEGRQGILDHWQEIEDAVRAHLQATGERIITFWQINAAREAALAAWVNDQIEGFGLPLEETRASIATYHERMVFLQQAFEDGAISLDRYQDVAHQLAQQLESDALGLAAGLLEVAGASDEAAEVRKAIAVLQFEIDRRRLNMLYAEIAATEELSEAEAARWERLLGIINGFNPEDIELGGGGSSSGGNSGGSGFDSGADPLAAARAFLDRLSEMERADRQGLNAERERARQTYAEMAEEARSMAWQFRLMGLDVADVLKRINDQYAQALEELMERANQGLEDAVQNLLFGSTSPVPIGDQIRLAEAEYRRLADLARAGDLDARAQLGQAFTQFYTLFTGAYGSTGAGASTLMSQFLALLQQLGVTLPAGIPGYNTPSTGRPPLPSASPLQGGMTLVPEPFRFVREDLFAAQGGTESRLDTLILETRALASRLTTMEGVQRERLTEERSRNAQLRRSAN